MNLLTDRNSIRQDRKSNSIFRKRGIRCQRGKARYVVIFYKGTEERGIRTGGFHGVDSVCEIGNATACGLEGLGYPVVAE